jgi:hypothetical protein
MRNQIRKGFDSQRHLALDISPREMKATSAGDEREAASLALRWGEAVVGKTAPFTAIYYLELAPFLALGESGPRTLIDMLWYIRQAEKVAIVGTVWAAGSERDNTDWAHTLFERYGADAVAVGGWAGSELLTPFLTTGQGSAVFVACRALNPGGDFMSYHVPSRHGMGVVEDYVETAKNVAEAQKRLTDGELGLMLPMEPAGVATVRSAVGYDMPILLMGTDQEAPIKSLTRQLQELDIDGPSLILPFTSRRFAANDLASAATPEEAAEIFAEEAEGLKAGLCYYFTREGLYCRY